LDDYQGKVVLLNFWATWCLPCVYEMPSLNATYEGFRDDGFVVLGISVDENAEQYSDFLRDAGVTFPTARDPERSVSMRYGTMKYPESYLISRDGNVLRKYVGPEEWSRPEIANYIRSVL
jgi:peroxiredoxin